MLLELLVVIGILGLVCSVVLKPGPVHSERAEVEAALRKLAEGLRLARSEAILSNRPFGFTLDVSGHAYEIDGAPRVGLPPSVGLAMTFPWEETRDARTDTIGFAPDGSSSGSRIGLAADGHRAWIGVDWLTGHVSVTHGQ